MIKIYDINGNVIIETPVDDSGSVHRELIGISYVEVEFYIDNFVSITEGCYIVVEDKYYYIWDKISPEKIDTCYKYSLRFEGIESLLKRFIFMFRTSETDNKYDISFSLTSDLRSFVNALVVGINAEFTPPTSAFPRFAVGLIDPTLTEIKTITFNGISFFDALTSIAETYDTEYSIDHIGNEAKINIGWNPCIVGGEPVEFVNGGDIITSIKSTGSSNEEYGTRFYVFGGTKNIPKNYDSGRHSGLNNIYSEKRLRLPDNIEYVEPQGLPQPAVLKTVCKYVINDDIYPKNSDVITDVSTHQVTSGDDTFLEYTMCADGTPFKGIDDVVEGEVLKCTFETGQLTGMDFELSINKSAFDKRFTIVSKNIGSNDDPLYIPTSGIEPKIGDKFILTGVVLPQERIIEAENELLVFANKYAEEHYKNKDTYECEANKVVCHDRNLSYNVGQKVILVDPCLFGESGKESRICAYTKKINNLFEATYVVGNNITYTRLATVEKKLNQIIGINDINSVSIESLIELLNNFLHKDIEDTAREPINFRKGAHFGIPSSREGIYPAAIDGNGTAKLKNLDIGGFIRSLYAGKGAGIDEHGNAEVESLRVRSALEVLALIINRLSAIEGDQLLTEADTIESIEDIGNNCYRLKLKSKWDGYFTAQVANNVLKGIINTLAQGSGTYYTSWMRVNSVNTANNTIEVTMYPDEDVPAGRNYPPCELMKIARWGNQTDPERQRCIYLSSTEGRIVLLTGVTQPIIDASNYGSTFGSVPEFLSTLGLPVVEGEDYLYSRGIIVQDIIRMDHLGHPMADIVDRGQWSAAADYYSNAYNEDSQRYETSDVWYLGCKWRCAKTGTHTAPAWNNTDWGMVEGNPDFTVQFADTDYLFDPDNFNLDLIIIAKLYNQDITSDILDEDVEWTRYSEDAQGNERKASDNAWAIRRVHSGKTMHLTIDDCDLNGYLPKSLKFTATVTLRDGMTDTASFGY